MPLVTCNFHFKITWTNTKDSVDVGLRLENLNAIPPKHSKLSEPNDSNRSEVFLFSNTYVKACIYFYFFMEGEKDIVFVGNLLLLFSVYILSFKVARKTQFV